MFGGVGQQCFAVDVADGEDRGRGLQIIVHHDITAPVQAATGLFSLQTVGVGRTAHSHQRLGRRQFPAVIQSQYGLTVSGQQRGGPDARQAGAPGLAQQFLQFLGNIRILSGGQLRGRFHHGDGTAHSAEKIGHFQTDGPRAHDDQAFGNKRNVEQVRAVQHGIMVRGQTGEGCGTGAARQDDVPGGKRLFTAVGRHDAHRIWPGADAAPAEQGYARVSQTFGQSLAGSPGIALHALLQ